MSDECKKCVCRGDFMECLQAKCSTHDGWIFKQMMDLIERLDASIPSIVEPITSDNLLFGKLLDLIKHISNAPIVLDAYISPIHKAKIDEILPQLEAHIENQSNMNQMKIYNVLWNDRHSDTTVTPFLDLDEAKTWAKEQAESVCRFPEDMKELTIEGRLYHIEYSCEGDCLFITEHDLEEKIRVKVDNTPRSSIALLKRELEKMPAHGLAALLIALEDIKQSSSKGEVI